MAKVMPLRMHREMEQMNIIEDTVDSLGTGITTLGALNPIRCPSL